MPSSFRTLKEVARHALNSAGLLKRAHVACESRAERFDRVYSERIWTLGQEGTPLSGTGSSLQATERLRHALPAVLDELGAKTLLDVGCGDLTWMREVKLNQDYIGVDIVPSLVEQLKRDFAGTRRTFSVCDSVLDELPDADVVLCREVLFHQSFSDVRRMLANMVAKLRKYLILTSDRATSFNSDIVTGDFRMLNLECRPINLPPPQRRLADGHNSPERFLGVWVASDVARALG